MVGILLLSFVISACGSNSSPADAIENYLEALAAKDQVGAVSYSCAEWEEQALAEGASFVNVEVELRDLNCQVDQQEQESAQVICEGSFLFSYDAGEQQQLDLGDRIFNTINENGAWRMCGYQ